jgi:hypothetical protein
MSNFLIPWRPCLPFQLHLKGTFCCVVLCLGLPWCVLVNEMYLNAFFGQRGPQKNMRLPSVDDITELSRQSEYKLRNIWEAWCSILDGVPDYVSQIMSVDCGVYLCYTLYTEKLQALFCWSFTFAQVTRSPIMLSLLLKRTRCLGYTHCMICVGRKLALLELALWQDGLSRCIRYNTISFIALDKWLTM